MQGAHLLCCLAMGVEAHSQLYLVEQSKLASGRHWMVHC